MYIVQFTVADVPMGVELVDQMEREPHEVLHDFYLFIYLFLFILFFK